MTPREILRALAEQSRKQADLFDLLAEAMTTAAHVGHADATSTNLWSLPDDARLTTAQLASELQRSTAYVHKAIDAKRTPDPLPYRKVGKRLLFVAGEVRPWLARQEIVMRGPKPVLRLAR